MSKASPNYLVVDPNVSYLQYSQRLTPAQYAQFMQDHEGYTEGVIIVPYTQAMQRQVRAQLKQEDPRHYKWIRRCFNYRF